MGNNTNSSLSVYEKEVLKSLKEIAAGLLAFYDAVQNISDQLAGTDSSEETSSDETTTAETT